jgi:hypothetical protein
MSRPIILYLITANSSVIIHGFDTSTVLNRRAKDFPPCYPVKNPSLYGEPDLLVRSGSFAKRKTRSNSSMIKHSVKPEIMGTRSGYVILFTCPLCNSENNIVNKTPRDHYKETRDASCTHCRKHSTVITPPMNQRPGNSPVLSSMKLQMTK